MMLLALPACIQLDLNQRSSLYLVCLVIQTIDQARDDSLTQTGIKELVRNAQESAE